VHQGASVGGFIAEEARDRKPPATREGARESQVFGLFLIGDVLQHNAGELRHQRPEASIFLQEPDDAGIEISVKAVIIPKSRRYNPIALARRI
jgi:hypothetical protein